MFYVNLNLFLENNYSAAITLREWERVGNKYGLKLVNKAKNKEMYTKEKYTEVIHRERSRVIFLLKFSLLGFCWSAHAFPIVFQKPRNLLHTDCDLLSNKMIATSYLYAFFCRRDVSHQNWSYPFCERSVIIFRTGEKPVFEAVNPAVLTFTRNQSLIEKNLSPHTWQKYYSFIALLLQDAKWMPHQPSMKRDVDATPVRSLIW